MLLSADLTAVINSILFVFEMFTRPLRSSLSHIPSTVRIMNHVMRLSRHDLPTPFCLLTAPASRPAIQALVAAPVPHHDRPALVARRGVLLVQERGSRRAH